MNNKEIPKAYEAASVEDDIYKKWEELGCFNPDNLPGDRPEYFSVSMPPPNVTGVLHLGHALENTIMDTMVRYQRMKGKRALLVPGTDHAAVATQARVEDNLKKSGIENPRQELGREGLLEKIREYAENSKATILSQIRKMGTSCDWSRLAYTFDDARSETVFELFKKMYEDGLIYRGYRVINWSIVGQSTCSDDELEYVEQKTKLYTFKYSKDFPIAIATTRPETKLGDTAVAVNPKDERYKQYIGQKFIADVGAKDPLTITIIADENVDPEFGTGAVGVTPAHSQADYDMYMKNREIGLIQVIGQDGKMTENAGIEYSGLDINEARDKFVHWLRKNDLLIDEQEIDNNVATSDRFKDVVELLPMEQWFVDVNKMIPGKNKTLKDLMREAVTIGHNGIQDKLIDIQPDKFKNIYLQWIDNLRDWCISRQVWWGHRIPIWYKDGEAVVSENEPAGGGWVQDEDTLDTWFSSGAWTFSTLNNGNDLKNFHPTSWMQMGYEILFFWMARMILMTTYYLDDIPFQNVFIHGILRDKNGKKFSKSLGNGLDPLEIIEQYGTDALRLGLIKGIAPGNDSRFYEEKIESGRNFVNKLWNISRFIMMSIDNIEIQVSRPEPKTLADEWILKGLSSVTVEASKQLEVSDFSKAAEALYEFTWDKFADWYVEVAKIEGGKDAMLAYVLQTTLKLWHPFIPFVTEKIWQEMFPDRILMIENWPEINPDENAGNGADFETVREMIVAIRNLRNENKIEPSKKIDCIVMAGQKAAMLKSQLEIIKRLARLENLEVLESGEKPDNSIAAVVAGIEIFLFLKGAVNVEAERKRIGAEIANVKDYIVRQEVKLKNNDFTEKAPAKVIEIEKVKLAEAQDRLVKLEEQFRQIK